VLLACCCCPAGPAYHSHPPGPPSARRPRLRFRRWVRGVRWSAHPSVPSSVCSSDPACRPFNFFPSMVCLLCLYPVPFVPLPFLSTPLSSLSLSCGPLAAGPLCGNPHAGRVMTWWLGTGAAFHQPFPILPFHCIFSLHFRCPVPFGERSVLRPALPPRFLTASDAFGTPLAGSNFADVFS